jgi:hypothetical protein
LAGVGFLLAGPLSCKATPNQFRVIRLEEAQRHLRDSEYTIVEAVQNPPRADAEGADPEGTDAEGAPEVHWELPLGAQTELIALAPGPLLIIAPSLDLGYRSAAAAARTRGGDVLLFISESAEQRRTLYAPLAAKGAAS